MTLYVDTPMKLSPAECCFEAFGGVRETARVLGLTAGCVSRWNEPRRHLGAGEIPQHHIRVLLDEAARRGKTLTLEHLVFGRDPLAIGVVVVKSGKKIEVKPHDHIAYMVASLSMAGG